MALFESYERRVKQITALISKEGIASDIREPLRGTEIEPVLNLGELRHPRIGRHINVVAADRGGRCPDSSWGVSCIRKGSDRVGNTLPQRSARVLFVKVVVFVFDAVGHAVALNGSRSEMMLEVGRMSPYNNRSAIALTTRALTALPKAL